MESMNWEIVVGLLLGIGLSASCGFRVFIPLLIASIAGKMHWIPMADSFAWLSSWTAIICFGVAAVVEALAYYVPVVDNLLDTIATPVAVMAGALVSASTMVHLDPTWQWILGLMIGGGTAGVMQAGTSLLRLGSTKFTAGTGNAVVNTGEIGVSLVGSIMAILMPVIVGIGVIITVFLILYFLITKLTKRNSNAQSV
jgi:hypothetical protein